MMKLLGSLVVSTILATLTSTASGDNFALRGLQSVSRLWDISEPVISYQGMQLDLNYIVRDQVRANYVTVELFRDDECTKPIEEDNNYIVTDIINDLTTFGDGSGTRTITVNVNIDPTTISQSRIISFTAVQPIVAFCARLSLTDPQNPSQPANARDTEIVIGVDITDKIEITGIITDEEDQFGAEAFECDSDDQPIATPQVKNQGDTLRMCVQPDEFTRGYGVAMKGITAFRLTRGDVDQDVIVPIGVVQNLKTTDYRCIPGQPICSITTVVSNDFYYSNGIVSGVGEARMQYEFGGSRRLVKIPIRRRKAGEAGGFAGSKPFSISFRVDPSPADYKAIAYRCDSRNEPMSEEQLAVQFVQGDTIRICVAPDEEARNRGVYMRTIASFFFEQGDNVQFAVEPTGKQAEDGATLMLCNPGEHICAFKTQLSGKFFNSKEPVTGTGEIHLQFGTLPPVTRRTKVVMQRAVQITDAGFAGAADVALDFEVDPNYVPPTAETWQDDADEWWHDTPLLLRLIYIIALVVLVGILFCILWGLFCGWPNQRKEDPNQDPQNPKIIIQPIYMAPAAREVDSDEDEIDFCDTLSNPEEYYFEPEEPPLEAPVDSRSVPVDVEVNNNTTPPQSLKKALSLKKEQSVKKLENDSVKSPRSSRRSGESKSPRPGRKRASQVDDDGIRVSKVQADDGMRASKVQADDGIRVSVSQPADDGIRVSQSNPSSQADDGIRVSKVIPQDDSIKSASQRSNMSSVRSPRPGAKKRASERKSPMPRSSVHSSKSPRKSRVDPNLQSPGGRKSRVDPNQQSPGRRKSRVDPNLQSPGRRKSQGGPGQQSPGGRKSRVDPNLQSPGGRNSQVGPNQHSPGGRRGTLTADETPRKSAKRSSRQSATTDHMPEAPPFL